MHDSSISRGSSSFGIGAPWKNHGPWTCLPPPNERNGGTGSGRGVDHGRGTAVSKWHDQAPNAQTRAAKLTDAGVEHLRGMTRLQVLDLQRNEVTDVGLQSLEGMAELRSLDLSHNKVTGAGLKNLRAMSNLERLSLDDTGVTDDGVSARLPLRKLRSLRLGHCAITDQSVETLGKMTSLSSLGLGSTKIGDAGLAGLLALRTWEGSTSSGRGSPTAASSISPPSPS